MFLSLIAPLHNIEQYKNYNQFFMNSFWNEISFFLQHDFDLSFIETSDNPTYIFAKQWEQ